MKTRAQYYSARSWQTAGQGLRSPTAFWLSVLPQPLVPPGPVCGDHGPAKGHITEETFLGSGRVTFYNANSATL